MSPQTATSPPPSELADGLPRLREDLTLIAAAAASDGSPCWHLCDPAANAFYHLRWAAFEILSRWSIGNAQAIVDAIKRDTTLEIDAEDIGEIVRFLRQHHLLEARSRSDSERLLGALAKRNVHWLSWLLKNYLFFRVPLVRPGRFLDRWVGCLGILWSSRFWACVGLFALLTLFLVARQWHTFVHSFSAYQGWQMFLSFGVATSIAKILHELGHAFVARHHACKIPSMGVAFLVMWPVLYTDTNEAWKLKSARARLQIGFAGMAAELLLAVLATFLWVILPDGLVRASMLFLATTSWVMTLAINISPFMRFDGYFLLMDLLGLPNLHQRSFALGRWCLREKLFGLGLPPPEMLGVGKTRFLIGFAFATWLYRLAIFLSIAFLVYHVFFKALGIVLMLVELGWFVALPLLSEPVAWWKLRHHMHWNRATLRALFLGSILICLLVLPWQTNVSAPAILAPAREQVIFANVPARIDKITFDTQQEVRSGTVLMLMQSPDLDYRIRMARVVEANWRRKVEQQNFIPELLGQGDALKSHWQEAVANLDGLIDENARLTVTAPFDGIVLMHNQDLVPGAWVAPREALLVIGDPRQSVVEVYVGEDDFGRLQRGRTARFVPEAPEFGRRDCRIASIDSFNMTELDEPALASQFGGGLNVQRDLRGGLKPVSGLYRVRLDQCFPAAAPALRIRGTAHLSADGQSPALTWVRHLLRVFLREAGF